MDQNTKDILDTVNFIKDRMLSKDEIREEFPGMIREELKPNSTPQALSRILRGSTHAGNGLRSLTTAPRESPSSHRAPAVATRSAEKHHETEGRL
jgi:hypothetical protein